MRPTTKSGFGGLYAILYAYFDAKDRLDREVMHRQTQACLASGAHGMAALGLATEVSKLTPQERLDVMCWLVEDTAGKVPVSITIFGNTPADQIAPARQAADLGVDWLILQPPQTGPMPEADLVDFFAQVMSATPLPMAIQNAPQFLGLGLSDDGLARLRDRCPNFTLLKGEGSAMQVGATVQALDGALDVFNGRAGLELPDNLHGGCVGMISAPECIDFQVRLIEAFWRGDQAEVERIYARMLPLLTFLMQSVDQFICYGKRLVARRMGVTSVYDRQPSQAPTELGLASMIRYGDFLPDFTF